MKTLSQKKLRALLIALTALLLALAAVLGITSFKNGGETETASAYTYSDIAIIKLTFYNDTSWVKTIYNFNGDNLISQSSSNTSQSANGYGFNFKWYSANPASNPYTEWMYYGSSNFYWGPYQFDAYVACIKSGSSYLLPYIVINSSGEYRKSGVATVTSGGTVNASSIGATSSSTQYMYIPAGSSSNAITLNYAIDSSYRVYTNSSSVTGTTLYLTGSGVTTDSTSSSIVHNYTQVSTTAESAVTTYVSSAYSATYTGSTITHPLYSSYSSTFTFSGTTSKAAAGSYSFTVTPKTGYRWSDGTTDSKTVSWTVAQASVSSATVTLGTSSYTYDGTAKTPTVTVKVGSTTLTSGTDYTVSYSNNTNAGTATVTVTGTGNYTGTATATYTISKASVTAPTAVTGLTYTGTSQTGVASGSNYTLSGTYYATAAGSYTATAALSSSNYQWSDGTTADKSISWTIAQASISSATVSFDAESYTYTGSALTPVPTVTLNGTALTSGTDYTVSYSNNTNAGTATVTVTGTDNYSGNAKATFAISAADISEATVAAADQYYTGSALTTTVTVTGIGNFADSKTEATFSIIQLTYHVGTSGTTYAGDGTRAAYASECSEALDTAYDAATALIESAQENERAMNEAVAEIEEMIASNKYSDSTVEALQELLEILEDALEGNVEIGESESLTDYVASLLEDVTDIGANTDVIAVTTGEITIVKDEEGNTVYEGDYEDETESVIWGIVTNDTGMDGGIQLVIEETESELISIIEEAAGSGNLVAAEGSELSDEDLESLVSDKEVKATLDIYLLKDNAKVTEFDGAYIVMVLMPSEWRSYSGLQVVYIGDDGTVEVYDTTVEGNYLIFTTVHFSEFVVLGEKDTNLTWLVVVLAVLLAGEIAALAALVILKKKKNGSGSVNASAFVPAGLLAAVVPSGAVPASIVLGVFVVLAAGAIVYVCLRKNKKNTQDSELEEQEASEEAEGLAASESAPEAELAPAAYAAETAAAGVGAAEEAEGKAVSGEPKGAVLPTAAPYGGYNKSYLAKLIQSDGGTKGCYAALKDEVLSYGCKSRTSWRAESFRIGRKVVLKFVMRGKTFCLCWEGDASAYAGSKYKVEELRARKSGGKNLIVYRMKNARRLRYAKELLAEILGTYGLVRSDIREHCVPPAYEDTEALLEKGLIKKVKTAESGAQGAQPHLPVQPKDHVSVAEADDLMSNEEAETFIEEDTLRYADKTKTGIVNVDTLARYFESGEKITLEDIKKRVPDFNGKVTYVKVLARGTLSKAFTVEADDFSLKAVKMIVLTGGKVIRTRKKDE